jgi:hypothetical protein
VESREEIRARLRAMSNAPTPPPLEATRAFLESFCNDSDTIDEVRDEVARAAAYNPRPIQAALHAIEAVIADPPRDGTLSYMVAVDANRSLDDPSDTGALEYLRQIAGILRDLLGPNSANPARRP